MNLEQSLELFEQGEKAWNSWANNLLTERKVLESAGTWMRGDQNQWNEVTRSWHERAKADFSGHKFTSEVNFGNFHFPGEAIFMSAKFKGYVSFQSAKFHYNASFLDAIFFRIALFNDAEFEGVALQFPFTIVQYVSELIHPCLKNGFQDKYSFDHQAIKTINRYKDMNNECERHSVVPFDLEI